jgi:hypothetical protein
MLLFFQNNFWNVCKVERKWKAKYTNIWRAEAHNYMMYGKTRGLKLKSISQVSPCECVVNIYFHASVLVKVKQADQTLTKLANCS